MIGFYFEGDPKKRKPDEKFVVSLKEMRQMANNVPSNGGIVLDRNNTISLTSVKDWASTAEEVIETGQSEPFKGSFPAIWDDGTVGRFVVHYDGIIVRKYRNGVPYAEWTGKIWFTVRFQFPPDWDWARRSKPVAKEMQSKSGERYLRVEAEHGVRSDFGERHTRIAYILNLGKDFNVDSVHANAVQTFGTGMSSDRRLRITNR